MFLTSRDSREVWGTFTIRQLDDLCEPLDTVDDTMTWESLPGSSWECGPVRL